MFQPNDPRFWRALLGIIALLVGCSLAWLMLSL